MWIRSQDKERLMKVVDVSVAGGNIWAYSSLTSNLEEIYGEFKIGTYETTERAIEILDSIQSCIMAGQKTFNMPND